MVIPPSIIIDSALQSLQNHCHLVTATSTHTLTHLDKSCNLFWSLKHYPLIHGDGLLSVVPLYTDLSTKEQEREWRDHGGIMDEDGRTLHLLVVDHEFVCKQVLIRVHGFRVELDTPIFLGPQFRVTGIEDNTVQLRL